MGGIFIYFYVLFSVFISGNFSPAILAFLFVFMSFTGLGFLDDYLKVLKRTLPECLENENIMAVSYFCPRYVLAYRA